MGLRVGPTNGPRIRKKEKPWIDLPGFKIGPLGETGIGSLFDAIHGASARDLAWPFPSYSPAEEYARQRGLTVVRPQAAGQVVVPAATAVAPQVRAAVVPGLSSDLVQQIQQSQDVVPVYRSGERRGPEQIEMAQTVDPERLAEIYRGFKDSQRPTNPYSTPTVLDTASPEASLQPAASGAEPAFQGLYTYGDGRRFDPDEWTPANADIAPPEAIAGREVSPLELMKRRETEMRGGVDYLYAVSPLVKPRPEPETVPPTEEEIAAGIGTAKGSRALKDIGGYLLDLITGDDEAVAETEPPAAPATEEPATVGDVTVAPDGTVTIDAEGGPPSMDDYYKQQQEFISKQIETLFPPLDQTNPKQDIADAAAERQLAKDALLAQLALGGSMMMGAGKQWEGMGQGFIAAAGVFDKGFNRYQNALQDSADRYRQTQKDSQTYETAKKSAMLSLITQAATDRRDALKDYRAEQKERRTEIMDRFKPYFETLSKAEFGTELGFDAESLARAIDLTLKSKNGEFILPGPPLKHTRET
jgi:hypothetical protein